MESNKLIWLIDGQGDDIFAPTQHHSVVEAIHLRAQRISSRQRQRAAPRYGEVGMWDGLEKKNKGDMDCGDTVTQLDRQRASVEEQAGLAGMKREMMEVHGNPPRNKTRRGM